MRKLVYDVTMNDGTTFTTSDYTVVEPKANNYECTYVTRFEEFELKKNSTADYTEIE